MTETENTSHTPLTGLAAASTLALSVRLYTATCVGFGDSEALYAAYAGHPQPAYLDHPGLIGLAARAIGGGTAPGPLRAHVVSSIVATCVPWMIALACRACGATWRRSFLAAIVALLTPELAVGLFGMTPDSLLAVCWTGAIAFAALGLRSVAGSARAAASFGAAGVLAGAAAASKASGIALLVALGACYGARACRAHARTSAPWTGLAAGAIILAPVLSFEAHRGWPMLTHRLVATQAGAGLSLRNAGALVGGQLVYLSPLVLLLAAMAARRLWQEREDPIGALLFTCFLGPLAVLVPLCLWSRVAEPHWIAPALIALVPAAARSRPPFSTRLVKASCVLAGIMTAAVYGWVLVPSLLRFAPASYDARFDIANELYGWPEAVRAVRDAASAAWTPGSDRTDLSVVGPHWVICGQLEAALKGEIPVGCDTPIRDDFDDWWPRKRWRDANTIVWVTDGRFGPPPSMATHVVLHTREVHIVRGGRSVRVFVIVTLGRRAAA